MKRLAIFMVGLLVAGSLMAKGLRYSVCQVQPEYTEEERTVLSSMALLLSREDLSQEACYLQTIVRPGYYGSGVVIRQDGLRLLTTRQVVGYASQVTVTVYLHDKTLRFRECPVLGSDPQTNLALVALPASDDLEPLSLYDEPVEEGQDIRTAGFAQLNDQPLWQLNRGEVSNAILRYGKQTFIQHTAPLNPGTSGGPLLVRADSVYQIGGINMSSLRKRDEVAIAIPAAAVRATLAEPILHMDNDDLHQCASLTSERWNALKRHLEEQEVQAVTSGDALMPLDELAKIAARGDYYEKRTEKAHQERLNRKGLTDEVAHCRQQFFYHNYLSSMTQEAGINFEFTMGERRMAFMGLQFACAWTEARPIDEYPSGGGWGMVVYQLYDPRPVYSPLFGLYVGYQLPIRLAPKHVLMPRLSQGVNIGPCLNTLAYEGDRYKVGTIMLTSDSRFGLEYHYQMKKISLILGIDYTAHLFATGADIVYRYKDGRVEPVDARMLLVREDTLHQHIQYTAFNHGLGAHVAIGF